METNLLLATLEAAVPLRLAALLSAGGPTCEDYAQCRDFAPVLASAGDQLLFRGDTPGASARLFDALAAALAVLAYAPGGVTFAGVHWEVRDDA